MPPSSYHPRVPDMSTESSATQTIIELLKKALAGTIDNYDVVKKSTFPDKSVLSAVDVLSMIANMNSQTAQRFVFPLIEAAAAERNASVLVELRAISDKLDRLIASQNSADNSPANISTAAGHPTAGSDVDKKLSAIKQPVFSMADLLRVNERPEYLEWNSKLCLEYGTTCSFLIHTKQYDLAEFLFNNAHGWYRGPEVSAQLAIAGDLVGIEYLSNHTNSSWYDHTLVIEKAFLHGHLHILRWSVQIRVVSIRDAIEHKKWELAVSNDHLNIIQWMFIEFPEDAKKMSVEILAFATANNATTIVEWMHAMGLAK